MIRRVATAAVLILAIALGIWLKGTLLRCILLFCMVLSIDEMYRALTEAGCRPVRWTGYAFCAFAVLAQAGKAMLPGSILGRVDPAVLALTLGLLLALSVVVLRGRVDFDALMSSALPMAYPGLFFTLLLPLQDLQPTAAATMALILAFFIASANDTFALFLGVKFGKHRLSPEISPKKSVEGAVAGLVASVLFAVLVPAITFAIAPAERAAFPPLWAFALLGLAAGGLSQIGDLVASLIKRHCGIKDFGTIFPGHGGMLDRYDGILFCGAACYLFFKFFGF